MNAEGPVLMEVRGCRQAYHKEASTELVVLDDVNLSLREGEMVALLGRSGSGKSTLLRIVAGLLRPTELVVLDDVNLSLREGEMVALLGRSGSGKSTLLRIVAGLLRPTAGQVLWHGNQIEGPPAGVAMVFQSFALFPARRGRDGVSKLRAIPVADRRGKR